MTPASPAAKALHQAGISGQQLLELARQVTRTYQTSHGATPVNNEDLTQYILTVALRRAGRYDPAKNPRGDLLTYLHWIMGHACTDYYRSKAHGFRDHRKTRNDTITSIHPTDQLDTQDHTDFTDLVLDQIHTERWHKAAAHQGQDLRTWITTTLDNAAGTIAA